MSTRVCGTRTNRQQNKNQITMDNQITKLIEQINQTIKLINEIELPNTLKEKLQFTSIESKHEDSRGNGTRSCIVRRQATEIQQQRAHGAELVQVGNR